MNEETLHVNVDKGIMRKLRHVAAEGKPIKTIVEDALNAYLDKYIVIGEKGEDKILIEIVEEKK